MIGLVMAAVLLGEPDIDMSKMPNALEHYTCAARLVDYAGGLKPDEKRDAEIIEAAVEACAKTRAAALAEFRELVLAQPEFAKFIAGKNDAEVSQFIENDFSTSLLNQLRTNLSKMKRPDHDPN